jgi:hypothetical protein
MIKILLIVVALGFVGAVIAWSLLRPRGGTRTDDE